MGSVDNERVWGPFLTLEVDFGKKLSGEDTNLVHSSNSLDSEWHSIPLDSSEPEIEYSFHIIEGNQGAHHFRKMDLSMCGLSKYFDVDAHDDDETEALVKYPSSLRKDCPFVSMEATTGQGGMREVRVCFNGLEDANKGLYDRNVEKFISESGYREDGCLALLHQLQAFIKFAKMFFGGLLSRGSKSFLIDGWSSLLDRSVFFKSSQDTVSVCSKVACKKSNGPLLVTSSPTTGTTVKVPMSGVTNTVRPNPLQARDPQCRAYALPLVHFRPTDEASCKEGESKAAHCSPSVAPSKPATCKKPPKPATCKKPPKPPKYPLRSASLESGPVGGQRSVRKLKDRVSSKRKSRAAAAAVSSGFTPFIALVLTLGFGLLIVFQGLFVQPSVAYERNTDREFVDFGSDLKMFVSNGYATLHDSHEKIDPHLLASLNVDAIRSQATLSEALNKSMKELPWSRNSLASHVQTGS